MAGLGIVPLEDKSLKNFPCSPLPDPKPPCIHRDSWIFKEQSVQSLSHVRLFATPWTAARQASLSITNSRSLPKHMSIESVMPSNHLILCRPLLLLPSIFPRIKGFSDESVLHIRWPKYWSFSFSISISPPSEHPGLISLRPEGAVSIANVSLLDQWRLWQLASLPPIHCAFLCPYLLPQTLQLSL